MKRIPEPGHIRFLFLFVAIFFYNPAWGQEISFDVSVSTDWARGELFSQVSLDLVKAGIRLPSGRFVAEETLKEAYPWLLRPALLSLRVDSNSTVKDLVDRGELGLNELDILCREAEKIPPSLSPDLSSMTGRYRVFMEKISALLIRQKRAIEPARPLIPVQAADYTGIIIIADEELPIHGRRVQALVEPCFFPKIWDSDMNLIYERNMIEPEEKLMVRYVPRESVFRPTPSGLEGELAALVGPTPLRILAREVFGISPTDPVIDRDDAMKILSTEKNRLLLREGRVVLVLNNNILSAGASIE
jgi:hypothetical protein